MIVIKEIDMRFYLNDCKGQSHQFEILESEKFNYLLLVLSGDEVIIGCDPNNGSWKITYDSSDTRIFAFFDDLTYIGNYEQLKTFLQKEGRLLD